MSESESVYAMHHNINLRKVIVDQICILEDMVRKYREANNENLMSHSLNNLTDAHYQLYELNKEYDEYLAKRTAEIYAPPKKSFLQALFRK